MSRFVSPCCLPGRRFYLQFCVQFCKGEGALGRRLCSSLPPRWAGITQVRSTGYPVASRSMTSCYSRLKSLSAENMRHKISTCICSPFFPNKGSYFYVMSLWNTERIKQRDHTLMAWGLGVGGQVEDTAQPPRGERFPPPLLGCHSLLQSGRGGPHSVRNRGSTPVPLQRPSWVLFCFGTRCDASKFKARGLWDGLHKEEKSDILSGAPGFCFLWGIKSAACWPWASLGYRRGPTRNVEHISSTAWCSPRSDIIQPSTHHGECLCPISVREEDDEEKERKDQIKPRGCGGRRGTQFPFQCGCQMAI